MRTGLFIRFYCVLKVGVMELKDNVCVAFENGGHPPSVLGKRKNAFTYKLGRHQTWQGCRHKARAVPKLYLWAADKYLGVLDEPLSKWISIFKTLATNMLKGDLPISHYCWAVVSQGFSLICCFIEIFKSNLSSPSVFASGSLQICWWANTRYFKSRVVFSLMKANCSRTYCHFCLLGFWKCF